MLQSEHDKVQVICLGVIQLAGNLLLSPSHRPEGWQPWWSRYHVPCSMAGTELLPGERTAGSTGVLTCTEIACTDDRSSPKHYITLTCQPTGTTSKIKEPSSSVCHLNLRTFTALEIKLLIFSKSSPPTYISMCVSAIHYWVLLKWLTITNHGSCILVTLD